MTPSFNQRHQFSQLWYSFLACFFLLFLQPSSAAEKAIDVWTYLDRAIEMAAIGDHASALREISRALSKDPNIPDAYLLRGISQAALGRYPEAIRAYTKAINLKPNYAAAYLNRGQAHGMLGNYTGQLDDSSEVIRLAPEYAEAFINRGLAKSKLHDVRGAYDDYSQAIRLNPEHAMAYYCRGIARTKLGDGRGGIIDVQQGLKKGMGSPVKDFSDAIEKHQADPDWYIARGLVFLVLKNKEAAVKDFEIAVRKDPKIKPSISQLSLD